MHNDQLADSNHMFFIGVFWKISGKNIEKSSSSE